MEREEAIKIVKSHYPANTQMLNEALEFLIPELKESEDEKIKETLIDYFKTYKKQEECGIKTFFGIPTDNIIAWLEKQGEKKVPSIDFKAKDCYVSEVDGKIHDMTYNPTDKVEPKFKVGDWVVNNVTHNLCHIVKAEHGQYICDDCSFPINKENEYHPWSITDAKDGDVLVDVYGNIGIFQKNDDFDWSSYCSLGSNGGFRCFAIEHELDGSHPATKEQRDTLLKAMAKEGYEWDVEKKVFKTIDENGNNGAIEYVYILDYSTGRIIVAKHDIKESFEDFFKKLGLKENQCHYMTSSNILSIEYINF